MTDRARTIFLGTGTFAVPTAQTLWSLPEVDLVGVITAPLRNRSRGQEADTPVGAWASARGVETLRPARLRSPESLAEIERLQPDLLVLADYGQIVPDTLLALPRFGALNLHPSLLPRHRGATPVAGAILAGDRQTGVSLMKMDAGLDSGPILAQVQRPLTGRETTQQLEDELAHAAAALLAARLGDWLAGRIEPVAQDDHLATLTRQLKREDGRLDPTRDAAHLDRQVRAYQPWPGSFLDTPSGRLIVWRAAPVAAPADAATGTLIRTNEGGLSLVTADGALDLLEVQPAGGKRMTGAELLRGRPRMAQ